MYEKLFLALLRASSAHGDASRKAFATLELTEAQPKVLYILRREDGIVQKKLAEICNIRQPTLTVLLAKMEKQNYIYKETCYVSGRKRAFRIWLTEEGKKKAEQLEDVVEELERKGFAGFSEEERITLLEMLCRVEENMRRSD